jgi:PhnB protein
VDDIDRHFQRAKEEGATIVSEPEDMFWGGRSYRGIDPEGHRWEFLQIGRELAPEHWSLPAGITRDGQNAV